MDLREEKKAGRATVHLSQSPAEGNHSKADPNGEKETRVRFQKLPGDLTPVAMITNPRFNSLQNLSENLGHCLGQKPRLSAEHQHKLRVQPSMTCSQSSVTRGMRKTFQS